MSEAVAQLSRFLFYLSCSRARVHLSSIKMMIRYRAESQSGTTQHASAKLATLPVFFDQFHKYAATTLDGQGFAGLRKAQ